MCNYLVNEETSYFRKQEENRPTWPAAPRARPIAAARSSRASPWSRLSSSLASQMWVRVTLDSLISQSIRQTQR